MKKAGVWAGIATLLFASVILYQSFSLDYYTPLGPGPGFFPRWLSGLLIFLTLIYLVDSVRQEGILLAELLPGGKPQQAIISTVCGLLLFPVVVEYLGFVASSSILMFIMFIRDFKWYKALGISVSISVLLFVVFQTLLGVSLPVNDFGW